MKSDKDGVSTCPAGEERYEYFKVPGKGTFCQYDFRHPVHGLFSTVCKTLEKCREARDKWLDEKAAAGAGR